MSLRFEWDAGKAERNQAKHGVSFAEAATVLNDPLSVTFPDPDHSGREERLVLFGRSSQGRLLVVSVTERVDVVRIISARTMTSSEKRNYEHERRR